MLLRGYDLIENNTCKICGHVTKYVFSAKLLNKYNVGYYFCANCGFLQTEEPYWLDEAYNSAIGIEDTGILKRNLLFSKRVSVLISFLFNKKNKFLDYAGGYGIFVRLMRDTGFDFYWNDPFATNLVARGFEFHNEDKVELITAFECFEHFKEPIKEFNNIISLSDSILISTRVFKNTPPPPDEWWYYSLNSGQHISLYSIKTFQYLAKKYNLNLNTDYKSFHMLTKMKINNYAFNFLLKLSLIGLADLVNLGLKSKTDPDFDLIKKRYDL